MTWQFLALIAVLLIVSNILTGALFWHAGRRSGQLTEREALAASLKESVNIFARAREAESHQPIRRKRTDD